jgi:hypothetical protein
LIPDRSSTTLKKPDKRRQIKVKHVGHIDDHISTQSRDPWNIAQAPFLTLKVITAWHVFGAMRLYNCWQEEKPRHSKSGQWKGISHLAKSSVNSLSVMTVATADLIPAICLRVQV